MNEGSELPIAGGITDTQRLAITARADIRRRSQDINSQLHTLLQSDIYRESPEGLRVVYKNEHQLLSNILQGDVPSQKPASASSDAVSSHLEKGSRYSSIAPNVAALHFAKAAMLQQQDGVPYEEALTQAKHHSMLSTEQGVLKTTPADFLPDAFIIATEKKAMESADLPLPQQVAQAVQSTPSLAKDYALVLEENDRPDFLAAFPEHQQAALSLELDAALSEALDSELISDPHDIAQRDAVRDRVLVAFSQALTLLGQPGSDPTGRELGSKWSSKKITETLANLGGADTTRILKDISEHTTTNLKALNKQLKKKNASERVETLRPFISFTARVLDTLVEVDTKRGGVLAMRYLEMTALPPRLFSHFAHKLIGREYFTENLTPFLSEPGNIPILKKLVAKYGTQFNTIVDTLNQIPDYQTSHELAPHESEIFEALADLGTLTPRIFERYRQKPPEERKAFAKKIRALKPKFFRNVPIKTILDPQDLDILTEMVYIAYKPNQMTFEKVAELIANVDDHTEDISQYEFPEDGYPIALEGQGRYVVKEREQVDISSLRPYRSLFLNIEGQDAQKPNTPPFVEAVGSLFRPTTEDASSDHATRVRTPDEVLRHLLLPLSSQARVGEFVQRSLDISTENAHQVGSELSEIVGIYFRDNYERLLEEYLVAHVAEFQQIAGFLEGSEARQAISGRLEQFGGTVNWQEFDNLANPSVQDRLQRLITQQPTPTAEKFVASLLKQIVEREYIDPIRKVVGMELSKFTATGAELGYVPRGTLTAHISKNVGSFFAKAAAGICTAEDIPLFEREDHFHINVVENDEAVRANVMAYTATVNGNPSLILRGFNPTADWIGKIDVGSFCEQILAIARQFQEANGLHRVYISEQDHGDNHWHALSNRDQVARYLIGQYITRKSGVPFPLKVASTHTIQNIYPIPGEVK